MHTAKWESFPSIRVTSAGLLSVDNRDLALPSSRNLFWIALAIAIGVVTVVWLFTNHMSPQWDMHYYLDMAAHGLLGNRNLAAPFAYRPAAPLIVGALSRVLPVNLELLFRACDALMCVVFILSSFYFARSVGANLRTAFFAGTVFALNFNVVKWTLFSGTMVDIYAYPILLAAFYALLRDKIYTCLGICAVGLFFKEFLLVPIGVQTVVLLVRSRQIGWKAVWKPLLLAAGIVLVCLVLPHLVIHVTRTFEDIDPVNDRSSVRRLISYPLSRRHDFNILFAYLAGWFPILALLSPHRAHIVWHRLSRYRLLITSFMAFHFLLVMYGGTNIDIYITYCLPIQILVLVVILRECNVRPWEVGLTLVAVVAFNRIWMHVPLPENGLDAYLDFYGGYYMRVTRSSFLRMGELLAYLLAIGLLRLLILQRERSQSSSTGTEMPAGIA